MLNLMLDPSAVVEQPLPLAARHPPPPLVMASLGIEAVGPCSIWTILGKLGPIPPSSGGWLWLGVRRSGQGSGGRGGLRTIRIIRPGARIHVIIRPAIRISMILRPGI